MGRKRCWERRNCSLRAISPFPHSVFKKLVLQTRKSQGLFAKGLRCKVRSKLASLDNVDSDQTVQVRHCDTAGIFPEKEIAIVGSQHLE